MRYYIDNICVVKKPHLILRVIGWAFSENGEISYDIAEDVFWRVSRSERKDVAQLYNLKNGYCGFTIEIKLKTGVNAITIFFQDGIDKQETEISLLKYISRSNLKHTLRKNNSQIDPLSFMKSGSIDDKLLYCMDIVRFNEYSQSLFVRGWAFSENSKTEISIYEKDFKIKWHERKDVNQVYGDRYNLIDPVGFEFQLGIDKKQDDKIVIFIKSSNGNEYKLSFPCKTLLQQLLYKSDNEETEKTIANTIKNYVVKEKYIRKYGKAGAEYKIREQEIFKKERELNTLPYQYQEIAIPEEWLEIQKEKPLLSVIVAINQKDELESFPQKLINNFQKQVYCNWQLILVGNVNIPEEWESTSCQIEILEVPVKEKQEMLFDGLKLCKGEYILFMDQEDFLEKNYFSCIVEGINESRYPKIIYTDYDICLDGKPLIGVKREGNFVEENVTMFLKSTFIRNKCLKDVKDFADIIKKVKEINIEHCCYENRIQYHYAAVPDKWNPGSHAKMIAFYLTQYHENEENNRWWGKGFTEWNNVKRAIPMYEGHNQPRFPGALGYYDLVEDKSIQYKQIDLAKRFDVYGFCYYYYWFQGKRLLRKPLDQFIENKELDLPFCICWANETWSRRWDGEEHDILIQQVHNKKTDIEFIKDMIPMFKDKRYIKINGKPLLLIYRIELFPEPYKTIQRWRKYCMEEGIGEIHISIAQTFDMISHKIYGADSSVEFPPHKIGGDIINERILPSDSEFVGTIRSYREIVQNLSTIIRRDYNMITGCMMEWDNTARRMNTSNIYAEFSPELFQQWLIKNYYYTRIYNDNDIMFINAWNEWAEGTYLDPDGKYGTLMLEIVQNVLSYK